MREDRRHAHLSAVTQPLAQARQLLLDEYDRPVAEEEKLLINATALSLTEAPALVAAHGGLCYPAHIDKDANSVLAILGAIPPECDFSAVEEHFPGIMRKILEANERPSGQNKEKTGLDAGYGIYYNVNFPDIPAGKIRGIRTGYQGKGHWVREFTDWDPTFYSRHGITPEMLGQESAPSCEEGEKLYMMVGTFVDDPGNDSRADHHILENGYISVVAHNIDTTDYRETDRLGSLGFDTDF